MPSSDDLPAHVREAADLILLLLHRPTPQFLYAAGSPVWGVMPIIHGKNAAWILSLPGALTVAASIWPTSIRGQTRYEYRHMIEALAQRVTLVPMGESFAVEPVDHTTFGTQAAPCIAILASSMPNCVQNPKLRPMKSVTSWNRPPHLELARPDLRHPWLELHGVRRPDVSPVEWAAHVGHPVDMVPALTLQAQRRRLIAWYRRHLEIERARVAVARRYAPPGSDLAYAIPEWLRDDSTAESLADLAMPRPPPPPAPTADPTGLPAALGGLDLGSGVTLAQVVADPQAYVGHAEPAVRQVARALGARHAPPQEVPAQPPPTPAPPAETPSTTSRPAWEMQAAQPDAGEGVSFGGVESPPSPALDEPMTGSVNDPTMYG